MNKVRRLGHVHDRVRTVKHLWIRTQPEWSVHSETLAMASSRVATW